MQINLINIRDFATDKHKSVDDRPYGGGAGMVLRVDVVVKAIEYAKYHIATLSHCHTATVERTVTMKQCDNETMEGFLKYRNLYL